MKERIMSPEMAAEEFDKWAEYKKIDQYTINENQDERNFIINAFETGRLKLNEDFSIVQKLKFPVNDRLTELKYKARLTVREMQSIDKTKDKGVSSMVALASVLTDESSGLIRNLDAADFGLMRSLVTYFLS